MNPRRAILVLVPLAAACVAAPERRAPDLGVEIPPSWTARPATPAPVEGEWWTSFDDPRLTAVIQEALERNQDLRAAAARLDAAAAQARIEGADLLPQTGVGVRGARQKQNFFGIRIPGSDRPFVSSTFTSYGVSLDTTWEADLWGRIRAGKAAALADLGAVEAEVAAARLSIAAQTAKAWFATIEASTQIDLARETVDSFHASAERVRARYETGLRSPLDLRLSLANVHAAEALLEQRRAQHDRAVRQLEFLLGRYPKGSLRHASRLPSVPADVPAGLPAELVMRRPDLVAAERRLAATDARARQARRALYPRFALTASGGTSSQELEDLLDGDFSVWSIVGNLLQPVFQGGRLRAGVDRAEAGSEQALAEYASAALRAFAEVEANLAAEGFLARREQDLAAAAEQSVAARRLAESRYDAGIEGLIALLESQRRALDAESQLLTVRRQRLDTRVDLHLALGGGFRHDPPATTTDEDDPS